ncbi:MAG: Ig-like domain-containing protein, partial [Patescibacteria group bacterium]
AYDEISEVDGYYTEWNQLVDSLLNAVSKEYEEDADSETSPSLTTAQDHYFHLATLDYAGNWTSTAHLGPFWIDATRPSVSWNSPANGSYLRQTITLDINATDEESGVSDVTFKIKPTAGSYNTIATDATFPYSASFDTTTVTDGAYILRALVNDNVGNNNSSTVGNIDVTIDNTPPVVSWDSPTVSQTVSGSVGLSVSAADATSGVATTEFFYQRQDGVDSFHPVTSPWDTSSLALDNYTLRAVVTDTAGNSTTVDQTVAVAAVVSGEGGSTPAFGQITISWTTDRPTSGRIIYDTVSHSVLGTAPNYGYAFSTDTVDTSPKSTSHTITITGLSDNTIYFWRTVSAGSPTAIGPEKYSRTFSIPGAGGGGGGGGAPAPTPAPAVAAAVVAYTPPIEFVPEGEVLAELTATPTPSPIAAAQPVSEVKGSRTFNWWYVVIPLSLLGLIISGLLLWRRP